LREAGAKHALRGEDKTDGKAGESSRTPDGVLYKVNYTGDSGKIKEKLQGSALPWTVAGSTETILYFVGANELI